MVKASFLMLAYNSSKTIAEAVQSVLKQSCKEFKLIIVDDASTDATPDIISSFHDSRIQFVRNEKNLYIPDSANIGLQLIDTPYMLRIDSDDICLSTRLEKQLAFMEKHAQIGVCGSYVQFFGYKNAKWIMPCPDNEIKAYMIFNNCFANSSVIVRMDVMKNHDLSYRSRYLYPPMEDYDLWIRMLPFTGFANLPEVLVKKRWHKDSLSEVYSSQAWHKLNDFFEEHLPALGIPLNPRDRNMHTHFSCNLRGGDLNVKQADYAVYLEKLLAQTGDHHLFDHAAIKKLCLKKWMLFVEQIKLKDVDKIRQHFQLTRELFDVSYKIYFLKKKIKQLIPWY
jgi:glycosyltransferase involved in cell wall biosynthesis